MRPINILRIRLTACMIWCACGIISGGLTGWLSALASVMFYAASVIEWHSKNDHL
jgi:hypothetical protein